MSVNGDYSKRLLRNVHMGLPSPEPGETTLVSGDYEYWHYNCDGFNDQGWGCGYRTLQTICSWLNLNRELAAGVPSLPEIQKILVDIEDKEPSFLGSRSWIGSFEVCLVLDQRYEIRSKIIHVTKGKNLEDHVTNLKRHFQTFGSPVMMGGDKDCSSKGVFGLHVGLENAYLLVVDPHFVGRAKSPEQLHRGDWVKWQKLSDFVDSSFYNLCLPQIVPERETNFECSDRSRTAVKINTLHQVLEKVSDMKNLEYVGCQAHNEELTKRVINYYLVMRGYFLAQSVNENNHARKINTKDNSKKSKL